MLNRELLALRSLLLLPSLLPRSPSRQTGKRSRWRSLELLRSRESGWEQSERRLTYASEWDRYGREQESDGGRRTGRGRSGRSLGLIVVQLELECAKYLELLSQQGRLVEIEGEETGRRHVDLLLLESRMHRRDHLLQVKRESNLSSSSTTPSSSPSSTLSSSPSSSPSFIIIVVVVIVVVIIIIANHRPSITT